MLSLFLINALCSMVWGGAAILHLASGKTSIACINLLSSVLSLFITSIYGSKWKKEFNKKRDEKKLELQKQKEEWDEKEALASMDFWRVKPKEKEWNK